MQSVTGLAALLGVRLSDGLAPLETLRILQAEVATALVEWRRLEAASGCDLDVSRRARRWARAIDATWELARAELLVAAGMRRQGGL